MNNQLIIAKLAELASRAEVARIKFQNHKYWKRELSTEVSAFAGIVSELKQLIKQQEGEW